MIRFPLLSLCIICLLFNTILQAQQNPKASPNLETQKDNPTVAESSATTKKQEEAQPDLSEYDRWRGSSLGIRIDTRPDGFFVEKTLPQVDDSPLMAGDKLLSVGSVDFSDSRLQSLGTLLAETQPHTQLSVKIIRDEKEETLSVKTYRKEFLDIATIVERIQGNRIIKAHLADLDRTDELETISERMIAAVKKANSPREAHEGINQVIDEIGISHTALVPEPTYQQLRGSAAGEIGLALRRFNIDGEDGYYVVDIKPGTAAYGGEILIGDKIESLNSLEIEESRRLVLAGEEQRHKVFGVSAEPEEAIAFDFKHTANGETESVSITAGRTVSLRDSVTASARTIETNDRSFAYVRLWTLMSGQVNTELKELIDDEFEECDAMIIDLRGRGGTLPTVLALERTIKALPMPVIAITDELTRSAKELLSFRIKRHEHVTVIGERTTGAVTAATFARLPSGNVLMHPAASSETLKRYTDGVILEGNGVEPDEQVDFYEPFCNGKDLLLNSAIEMAVEQTEYDLP